MSKKIGAIIFLILIISIFTGCQSSDEESLVGKAIKPLFNIFPKLTLQKFFLKKELPEKINICFPDSAICQEDNQCCSNFCLPAEKKCAPADVAYYLNQGEQTIPGSRILGNLNYINTDSGNHFQNVNNISKWIYDYIVCHDCSKLSTDLIGSKTAEELVSRKNSLNGGCTDIGIVFTSIARAKGYPTIFVDTYALSYLNQLDLGGNCNINVSGHVFVNIYLDGEWKIYDPVARRFSEPIYSDVCMEGCYLNGEGGIEPYVVTNRGLDYWEFGFSNLRQANKEIKDQYQCATGETLIRGGIERTDSTEIVDTISYEGLPNSWDWRDVHGENWLTSVKSQYADNCWAFAAVGAMEAQINLYYNQHLDLDLSERHLTDCINRGPPLGMDPVLYSDCTCDTSLTGREYCAISYHGIVDEACNPCPDPDLRETTTPNCHLNGPICEDWDNRLWKNSNYEDYITPNYEYELADCAPSIPVITENKLKEIIITKGPLAATINLTNSVDNDNGDNIDPHNVVLVGYHDDRFIFKNSWGINDEETEEGYTILPFEEIFAMSLPTGPFYPPQNTDYWPEGFNMEINCVDEDNDNYCQWGISSEKPSTCPSYCQSQKDCDDSNPRMGPFISENNFYCLKI